MTVLQNIICTLSNQTLYFLCVCSLQELMDWHRPRIDALLQAGVDILAMETIPAQVIMQSEGSS